jgi:hypothetical protein
VFTGITGLVVGLVVGWILHIIKVNSETRSAHFNDLKEQVISPMRHRLTNKPYMFPSVQEAQEQAILYMLPEEGVLQKEPIDYNQEKGQFEPVLLSDFLDNHYPEVKRIWDCFCNYNSHVLTKDKNAREMIANKLHTLLMTDDFKGLNDPNKYHHLDEDEFKKQLKNLIITGKSSCSAIEEDPSQPGRVEFNGKIIYMLNDDDEKNKILDNLRSLCCNITREDSIIEEISDRGGYNELLEKRNKNLREFITKIDRIRHQTRK